MNLLENKIDELREEWKVASAEEKQVLELKAKWLKLGVKLQKKDEDTETQQIAFDVFK